VSQVKATYNLGASTRSEIDHKQALVERLLASTIPVREVLGLSSGAIRRGSPNPLTSYLRIK